MQYEWLDAYLLSLPGAEKDYKAEWGWFRYMLRGKLFAAVCSPGGEHKTCGGHDLVNLKCEIARSELLRASYPDILPGFYCDKPHMDRLLFRRGAAGGAAARAVRRLPPAGAGEAAQIRAKRDQRL